MHPTVLLNQAHKYSHEFKKALNHNGLKNESNSEGAFLFHAFYLETLMHFHPKILTNPYPSPAFILKPIMHLKSIKYHTCNCLKDFTAIF